MINSWERPAAFSARRDVATPRRLLEKVAPDRFLTQVRREEGPQRHPGLRDAGVARSTERIADCANARQQQSRQPQQQDVHIRPNELA